MTSILRFTRLACLAAVALAMVAGCPQTNNPPGDNTNDNTTPPTVKPILKPFDSPDQLLSYFREQAAPHGGDRNVQEEFGVGGPLPPVASDDAAAGGDGEGTATGGDGDNASGTPYSTTNLQEAGVDESDVVKNDGEHIFLARGRTLRIINADPAGDLAEIGQVELNARVDSLYLLGDTVLAIGQNWANYALDPGFGGAEIAIWPPYYQNNSLTVTQIDITDPAAPTIAHEVELEGSLATSRLINGKLILIISVAPELPLNPTPQRMAELDLTDVLPKVTVDGAAETMVGWESWLYPSNPDGYFMTAVVTLNASDVSRQVGSVAVLANAGTIYASTEAVYLTDATFDISDNYREQTVVHKFALGDDGVAEYVASGVAPGRLLNQFALSEHDGFLRLATYNSAFFVFDGEGSVGVGSSGGGVAVDGPGASEGSEGGQVEPAKPPQQARDDESDPDGVVSIALDPTQASSAVYVLSQDGGELNVVGSVEGIAPNERMFAARFLGNRCFLVTFEQIDPLFAIDLSDPTAPHVVGELEVPGYSEYLHPVGDNLLIGLGRSTDTAPWGGTVVKSVQLSLFDVSDLSSPRLIDQLSLGGYFSYSDAGYDHKAFTFLEETGMLAIPAQLYPDDFDPYSDGRDSEFVGPDFDGIVCYRVTADGFEPSGRLASVLPDQQEYYYTPWRRAVIIADHLFAVTPGGLRAAPLTNLTQTSSVVLEPGAGDDEGFIGGGDDGVVPPEPAEDEPQPDGSSE
ncbi:Beta propeller domain protein [Phycisphaerae bacterium RAS1]|nr:Beta propeller domain protein [Phycisphaerae bacterium RAS1]